MKYIVGAYEVLISFSLLKHIFLSNVKDLSMNALNCWLNKLLYIIIVERISKF